MKKLTTLFIVIFLWANGSWAQTDVFTQNFDGAWTIPSSLSPAWSGTTTATSQWQKNDYTTGWSYPTDGYYSPSGANTSTGSARFHSYGLGSGITSEFITPEIDLSGYTSGANYIEFYHINITGTDTLKVYLSTDGGATWGNPLIACGVASSWTIHSAIALNTTSSNVKIKFSGISDYGNDDIGLDQVKVYNYDPNAPNLTIVPNTPFTFGYIEYPGTSAVQTYILSGVNLTAGPIVVTAPTGFEVSLNGTTWTGSVNVSYIAPILANTTIYARFIPTADSTDYSGHITNIGGGSFRNASVTGTSNLIYCSPLYSSGGSSDFITQVTLETLSQATTSNISPYYINYTAVQNAVPDLSAGLSYNLSLTFSSDGDQYNGVWIDFNHNGTFDPTEFFTSNTDAGSNGTAIVVINLPSTATTGFTRMRIRGGDDSQPGPSQACGASSSNFGQAQDYLVNITAPPPDLPPTALTATNITAHQADLAWTENCSATSWEVEWGLSGFAQGSGTIISSATNPQQIINLSPITAYSYYVRANCGGTYSIRSGPYTFSTLCDGAYTIPYTQNFDTDTAPDIPICMTVTNNNGDANQWITSTGFSKSAPNSMYIEYNSILAMDDWFFTPALSLGIGTYKVSFWYRGSGNYQEKLNVKWGTTPNAADMTNGTIFDNDSITSGSYAQGIGYLTVTTAGDYYVGWHGYSDADSYYLVVDDISITQPIPHDVTTLAINMADIYFQSDTVITKATVKNDGVNTETFDVTMTIGAYTSTRTITSLGRGASQQVIFDPWVASLGRYSVNVCTNLATPVADMNNANDCISKPLSVKTPSKIYCYVAYDPSSILPQGPSYFYDNAPDTILSLAATTSVQSIFGGTWANGIWYGSEYYDASASTGGGWWTIDTTGVMTKIADLGRSFTGITYDHTAHIMYGVDYDAAAQTNSLYTIVPATGAVTLIDTVGPGKLFINLATDGSGFLYSIDIASDHLYKINPADTSITDIGACGIDMNYAQDMEYDYVSHTMFAAAWAGSGGLCIVNHTTGTLSLVGEFQGGSEITGLAIPYCNPPDAPIGSASQAFCSINNPEISDIFITGTNIIWYDEASGGNILTGATPLVNGTKYYASQTVSGCESETRLEVTVSVSDPPAPAGNTAQSFCSENNPIISDIAVSGTNISWYDKATAGNILALSTSLTDTTYYASQTVSGCESDTRLAVSVSVAPCTGINENDYGISVSIVPNPSNGIFYLSIRGVSENLTMNIFNMSGQLIYTDQINNAGIINKSIDMKYCQKGVYFIRLVTKNHTIIKKIVIQ